MRFQVAAWAGLWCATVGASLLDKKDPMFIANELNKESIKVLQAGGSEDDACTVANALRRKEWSRLCPKERRQYIAAVKCLQTLPAKSRSIAEGARTRYDDFVAVHINQGRQIHGTGNFLTWHRYFLWLYEKALQDECGYEGTHPYWNWFEYVDDLKKSPVFDGSETSMGGDGEFFEHDGSMAGPAENAIPLPSGHGGGCLKSGPFSDTILNLGPNLPAMAGLTPASSAYAYNPRYLRRDLTSYTTATWMNAENLLNITLGHASAGHFAVGGDASDFFTSTNYPTFFLHHAMVDRVYWLWQALHPDKAFTVEGTITMMNKPPSRDVVMSDTLQMLVLGNDITIGDAIDTMTGKFCYIYV